MQEVLEKLSRIEKLTLLGSKNVLTMGDVSLITGLSLSCLYKKTHNREIPFWKSDGGKICYFSKQEIEAWCLKHRTKTREEIEQEAINYIATGRKGLAV